MMPSGPCPAKLMFVAEAPGKDEIALGVPLVGYSGQEFTRMLREAGIDRSECRLDNVFYTRPLDNKLHLHYGTTQTIAKKHYTQGRTEGCRRVKQSTFFDSKTNVEVERRTSPQSDRRSGKPVRDTLREQHPDFDWPDLYTYSTIGQSKYLKPHLLGVLPVLKKSVLAVQPNLVVALGGVSAWALLNTTGITKIRGTMRESILCPGVKVLPTLHPAYILRQWDMRLIAVIDLMKAKREAEYPDIRRPQREIHINPTLPEMYAYYERYIRGKALLSFDTETERQQITCISFATTKDRAIVINFVDKSKPGYSHYDTLAEEVKAWKFVRMVLDDPIPKLAQNGLYDMQYTWVKHGLRVRNFLHDTMLLHHALLIEMKKDLGFLGSIYTDEAAWKIMRARGKDIVEKKDD